MYWIFSVEAIKIGTENDEVCRLSENGRGDCVLLSGRVFELFDGYASDARCYRYTDEQPMRTGYSKSLTSSSLRFKLRHQA